MPDEVSTLRAPLEADFGVDMTDDAGSRFMTQPIRQTGSLSGSEARTRMKRSDGTVTFPAMRSREIEGDSGPYTWRLGDVIHSTPVTVASPAENYHQLYRDLSYAQFLNHYQNRRQMVYFGANDGMLHAAERWILQSDA